MGKIKKKLKKIRIHHEGTNTLLYGGIGLVLIALVLWFAVPTKIPFWIFTVVFGTVYGIVLNFYQCPIRYFGSEDTEGIVVAPADGHIVVIEEVDENEYFHERRLMISIFMSLWNVHANWFPVDGVVKSVQHFDGNFHKAWLPKASEENEHADTIINSCWHRHPLSSDSRFSVCHDTACHTLNLVKIVILMSILVSLS